MENEPFWSGLGGDVTGGVPSSLPMTAKMGILLPRLVRRNVLREEGGEDGEGGEEGDDGEAEGEEKKKKK